MIQRLNAMLPNKRNADSVVWRVIDPAHGLFPALAVNDQRLNLGRKERTVMNR